MELPIIHQFDINNFNISSDSVISVKLKHQSCLLQYHQNYNLILNISFLPLINWKAHLNHMTFCLKWPNSSILHPLWTFQKRLGELQIHLDLFLLFRQYNLQSTWLWSVNNHIRARQSREVHIEQQFMPRGYNGMHSSMSPSLTTWSMKSSFTTSLVAGDLFYLGSIFIFHFRIVIQGSMHQMWWCDCEQRQSDLWKLERQRVSLLLYQNNLNA